MSAPFSESHITPGHVRNFQALRSPYYDNVTLMSCQINGEPGVVIVMVDEPVEGRIAVMPLFVAITPGMDLVLDGEHRSSGGGEGGGPKDPREEFEVAKPSSVRSSADQDGPAPVLRRGFRWQRIR